MKRVRHNAESLVERLEGLGYQFSSTDDALDEQLHNARTELPDASEPLPLADPLEI